MKHYPIILTLLIFCANICTGQMSDYMVRQQLSLALQDALLRAGTSGNPNGELVVFSNYAHDGLQFIDYDGSCKSFINNELRIINDGELITLKVLRRPSTNNMDVLPGSHRLICRLNGWLLFSWGYYEYNDFIGEGVEKHEIGVSCKTAVQNFFMGKAPLNSNGKIKEALQSNSHEWLSESTADDNTYEIFKYDGTPVSNNNGDMNGTELFNCPRQDATTGDVHYIGKYKDGETEYRDTGLAKIAYSYIEFKDYENFRNDVQNDQNLLDPQKQILTSIEISAHTEQYSNDCSFANPGYNLQAPPMPQNTAGVSLKITYLDANNISKSLITSYNIPQTIQNNQSNPNIANETLWNFFSFSDNTPQISHWVHFDVDHNGYLKLYLHRLNENLSDSFLVFRIRNRATPAEYCEVKLPKGGSFSVDNMTGEIIYTDGANIVYSIPCLEFCKKISGYRTVDGVLASSAVKLNDAWDKENLSFRTTRVLDTWNAENRSNNAYETGARGHWRPEATFAYKTQIKQANGPDERIYSDAGVYLNDQGTLLEAFRVYDWKNPSANTDTKWLKLNEVTITSPYGEPLEEKDILGIYSSAKFSHKNTVPKMVARNAPYSSIEYQSFEDWSEHVNTIYAHSGRNSLKLDGDDPSLATIPPQDQPTSLLLSVWVKQTYPENSSSITNAPITSSLGSGVVFKRIAKTGEWTLYEAEAINLLNQANPLAVTLQDNLDGGEVWIDDFKIQPLESEATCYAYDPVTLKLAAQFDDRHFGVFYQYNSEGKLIRKLRETERGLKTVTETQYHTPLSYFRDGTTASAFLGPNPPSFGIQPSGKDLPDIPNDPMNGVRPPSGGVSADVDILNLEIGPQGYDVSVFGTQNLPDWDSFTRWFTDSLSGGDLLSGIDLSSLDSLQFPTIPAVEQLQVLEEIKETESLISETVQQANNQSSDSIRQQLMLRATELRKRRQELIEQRLGVSEQDFRDFVEKNREDEELDNQQSTDQEEVTKPEGEE